MHRWPLFLLLLALLFTANNAFSASFDCNKATTPNENQICANPALSELDEAYQLRYRKLRKADFYPDKLKADAIFALKMRDKQCANLICLKNWYVERITQFDIRLNKIRAEELTGVRTTNLRSFANPFHARLKSDCQVYFSDYAQRWDFKMEKPTSYLFSSQASSFELTLISTNQLQLTEFDSSGLERNRINVDIAYSKKHNEWRSSQTLLVKPASCRINANKRWKYKVPARKKALELQGISVGEINISALGANQVGPVAVWDSHGMPPERPYHRSSTPVYDAINGKQSGEMRIELYSDTIEGSEAHVILVDNGGLKLANAAVLNRNKVNPAMLVFALHEGWYKVNIDGTGSGAVWLHDKTTHPSIIKAFIGREQMISRAEDIRVRSAHRLRSGPSTQAEIVTVLERDQSDLIVPLESKGNWLKVIHVSPDPGLMDTSKESLLSLNNDYNKQIGWLKWRKSPAKEYVDFSYHGH